MLKGALESENYLIAIWYVCAARFSVSLIYHKGSFCVVKYSLLSRFYYHCRDPQRNGTERSTNQARVTLFKCHKKITYAAGARGLYQRPQDRAHIGRHSLAY
jgi:hypothetical protein